MFESVTVCHIFVILYMTHFCSVLIDDRFVASVSCYVSLDTLLTSQGILSPISCDLVRDER